MRSLPPPYRDLLARCPMERLIVRVDRGLGRFPSLRVPLEIPWYRSGLTIALGDCNALELFSGVSSAQAYQAVCRAVGTWNAIGLPIELLCLKSLPELPTPLPDVVVSWIPAAADPEAVLGGMVQAHADYPPGNTLFGGPPLPIHFNANLLWGIEVAGRLDIETIALHELGHVLGLIYHSGPDTIMYDSLAPAPIGVRHALDDETRQRAARLYQVV